MKLILILWITFLLSGCFGPKEIIITLQPDGNKMAYLTKEFTVKANQKVNLIMNNTSTIEVMKHNIVILNDETKINEVGQQALSAKNYIPNHPAIIVATPIANAGTQTNVRFRAPKTPGKYPFICTYPGHYIMMKGVMIVE